MDMGEDHEREMYGYDKFIMYMDENKTMKPINIYN